MTLLWVDKIIQWRGHPLEDLTKTKCVFAELADFFFHLLWELTTKYNTKIHYMMGFFFISVHCLCFIQRVTVTAETRY